MSWHGVAGDRCRAGRCTKKRTGLCWCSGCDAGFLPWLAPRIHRLFHPQMLALNDLGVSITELKEFKATQVGQLHGGSGEEKGFFPRVPGLGN